MKASLSNEAGLFVLCSSCRLEAYTHGMRKAFSAAITLIVLSTAAAACGVNSEPIAALQWYREAGWHLPDLKGTWSTTATAGGWRPAAAAGSWLPGVTVRTLTVRKQVLEFAPEEFVVDGERRRTQHHLEVLARNFLVRYEMNGRVFAYVYPLTTVRARRQGKYWKILATAACEASVTYVDDRGDGVFRLLAPNGLSPELIPQWVGKPRS